MSAVTVLPLAVVMVSGPQLLSAVFLATSEQWRRNSAAFILGAGCSISLTVTAAYFLATGTRSAGTSNTTLTWMIAAALVVAAVHVYRTRETAEPPAWMGTLTGADPRYAFRLGFLLLGFFPTDILTSVA